MNGCSNMLLVTPPDLRIEGVRLDQVGDVPRGWRHLVNIDLTPQYA